MNVANMISRKRDGQELSSGEIEFLIHGFAKGDVPEYQMSAWAMAVYFQGMSLRETIDLTRAMRDSGECLDWDSSTPVCDKHSTGGVGDKISIPLAPALAACGARVPMISGRGLGPTGGTLDKLESIPGFRCDLSSKEFSDVVDRVGCVISGTTENIAPADRKLYALRDVTATVPAIPLITASILSKKLAEGLDALVLDVKWGSGAFMKSVAQATQLAETIVQVANKLGTRTTAIVTDMNQPIGQMVGNACELIESIEVLKGQGPDDTRTLTLKLGGQLLFELGTVDSLESGRQRIATSLDDGKALAKFEQMIEAQGGNLSQLKPLADESPIHLNQTGYLAQVDCELIGRAVIEMGGGRKKLGDSIDHSTGLRMLKRIGDPIQADEPIAKVYHQGALPNELDLLNQAFTISDKPIESLPLVVTSVQNV